MNQDDSRNQDSSLFYFNDYSNDSDYVCLRLIGDLKCKTIESGSSVDDEQQLIIRQFEDLCKTTEKLYFYIESTNLILSKTKTYSSTTNNSSKKLNNSLKKSSDLFDLHFKNNKCKDDVKTKDDMIRKYIPIQILKNVTVPKNCELRSPLFINHKGICRLQIYKIPIDLLVIVNANCELDNLYSLLIDKLNLHLETIKQCYLTYYKNDANFQPETFHYKLSNDDNSCSIVTVIYPSNRNDEQLRPLREDMHKLLGLSFDKPCFRRSDVFQFVPEKVVDIDSSFIKNIHSHVKPSGVQNGKQSLVKGDYVYYHYMQSGINDNGWGCAYRSFQTIFSWFKLQSYTNKNVPTHREIQQTLYDIGDKPRDFIGSSQWIGSMEISFCLSHMLGVEAKIINVSRGSEIADKVRELQYHFESEGTPIMIGGGLLAHTIIGVDFNELTGEAKYLVLDPHYTGADEIKTIVNKGWCGWKDIKFWNDSTYYNMCCPIRSRLI